MGVILDSSATISAERSGLSAKEMIRKILAAVGDQEVALSAIGFTEMVHGLYRTTTPAQRSLRSAFLEDIAREAIIYPYTQKAAEIAGRIDAEQRIAKQVIPYSDLLIGATALSLGFPS